MKFPKKLNRYLPTDKKEKKQFRIHKLYSDLLQVVEMSGKIKCYRYRYPSHRL